MTINHNDVNQEKFYMYQLTLYDYGIKMLLL